MKHFDLNLSNYNQNWPIGNNNNTTTNNNDNNKHTSVAYLHKYYNLFKFRSKMVIFVRKW